MRGLTEVAVRCVDPACPTAVASARVELPQHLRDAAGEDGVAEQVLEVIRAQAVLDYARKTAQSWEVERHEAAYRDECARLVDLLALGDLDVEREQHGGVVHSGSWDEPPGRAEEAICPVCGSDDIEED